MDATAASEEALLEAAGGFLSPADGPLRFDKASGGVNNRVYWVRQGEQSFVLRVYNNGGNAARVRYEHTVLELLRDASFFFAIPRLIRSRSSGATFVPVLSSTVEPGTEACMFEAILGTLANVKSLAAAQSAGEAIGQLVQRMADIGPNDLPSHCPNPCFRDVYAACPGRVLQPEEVERIVKGPEFEAVRQDADYLLSELSRVVAVAAKQSALPEQQIHADAHLDNLLAVEDRVTAVLDFEFSARDWRVMEACVGLTKYVATSDIDIPASIAAFLRGYGASGAALTAEEARFVPDGMVLRILSNVVFFAGRATATPPQDNIQTLVNKIVPYAKRCRWIEANRESVIAEATKLVK